MSLDGTPGLPPLGLCPTWHLYPCTLPRWSRAPLWDILASGGVEMMRELRGSWRAWAARGANALETFAGFYLNEHSFPPPREFGLRPKAQDLITLSWPALTQMALLLLKLPVPWKSPAPFHTGEVPHSSLERAGRFHLQGILLARMPRDLWLVLACFI